MFFFDHSSHFQAGIGDHDQVEGQRHQRPRCPQGMAATPAARRHREPFQSEGRPA